MKSVAILAVISVIAVIPLTIQNVYACNTYLDIGNNEIFHQGDTIEFIVKLSSDCSKSQEVKYAMTYPSGGTNGGKVLLEPNTQESFSLKIPSNAVSGKYNIQSNSEGAAWSMVEFWVIKPTEKIEDFVEKKATTGPEKSNYGSLSNSIDVVICHEYNLDGSCKVGTAGVHLQDYYDAQNRMQTWQSISAIVILMIIIGIIVGVIIAVRRKVKKRSNDRVQKRTQSENEQLQKERIQWNAKLEQDREIQELKDKVKKLEDEKNKNENKDD